MTFQATFWAAAAASLGLALTSGVADSRRARRVDLDATGWVPWRGIQVTSIFAAVLLAILAYHFR